MTYLAILVITAIAGFTRLWVKHRRRVRNRYRDIDSFGATLRQIASREGLIKPPPSGRRGLRSRRAGAGRRPSPLDPARRAAALARIEQRRRTGTR